ncbi:putative HTH-type transcriptional regulator [Actinomadura rubteroloni]|uniref:Putative HTH-type transcriptional regulator n=1 Tax=Actinomadura rubteroloni TaxID=1926885 RepID=A0A2P4UES6_9ACTN|nr:helix-turn-helix transcriptional regulator [Actinomadura rubteroloni]POM23567.1 putative HTH-type transcriptional regulator [Actinomadura rubteroloni]
MTRASPVARAASAARSVVFGPWGSGRSWLLDALAERVPGPVVRISGHPDGPRGPYGAVAELLAGLEAAGLAPALTGPLREVTDALVRRAVPPAGGWDPVAVRLAVAAALGAAPSARILVDDAQWLDAADVGILAGALRAVPARVTATEPRPGNALRLCGPRTTRLLLPPLPVDDVAALLEAHGLPARWAPSAHRACGGNPRLAVALAESLPADAPGPARMPSHALDAAADGLARLSADVRATLTAAALVRRPTAAVLHRAGYRDAAVHLEAAACAGVVEAEDDGTVRFTAGLFAAALVRDAGDPRPVHAALAAAVEDPVQAVRHRLLARDGFDAALAAEADRAAAVARSHGRREPAGELALLAARRTPPAEDGVRRARLRAAAADAGAGGSAELARRVCAAVEAASAGRAERVAALLAAVDAGGQALHALDDVLAAATAAAGDDPALAAAVQLRTAVRHNLGGDPARARAAAARSVELARRGGDRAGEATALTMLARMERITGDPAAANTLAAALALDVPVETVGVQRSPQYLAARHAVFDDRLDEARERLLALLPVAERRGDAEDLEEVLRSLAEVDVRHGACARALDWSDRAVAVCAAAGLSPGPAWYTAAVAQTAGGDLDRAADLARRAVRSSRREHDLVFLSRGLLALGSAHLAAGRAADAVTALREVAALEARQQVADPRVLRWRPELAEALAAVGATAEAEDALAALEPHPGVDRAAALCAAARRRYDEAAARFHAGAAGFAALGMPVEAGRTLLAAGRVERARRRRAAARTRFEHAAELFDAAGARPWSLLAAALLDRPAASAGTALTGTERRVAVLVAAGATNREAAQRLFLSVKTVEAALSRVYRKLDVRSRTELAGALAPRA